MTTNDEYLPLVAKLLDRSREGKVAWQETADPKTFIAVLVARYAFEIRRIRDRYDLTMRDIQGVEVFSLNAFDPSPDTSREQDRVFEVLSELYDRARRSALNVDHKIGDVSSLLDKL